MTETSHPTMTSIEDRLRPHTLLQRHVPAMWSRIERAVSQPIFLMDVQFAEGAQPNNEGTPRGAEGTPCGAEGTPCGAEGTPRGAEGTPCGATGTEDGWSVVSKRGRAVHSVTPIDGHWKFTIRGTTDIDYSVAIAHTGITCSCPDYTKRGSPSSPVVCKHIILLLSRILGLPRLVNRMIIAQHSAKTENDSEDSSDDDEDAPPMPPNWKGVDPYEAEMFLDRRIYSRVVRFLDEDVARALFTQFGADDLSRDNDSPKRTHTSFQDIIRATRRPDIAAEKKEAIERAKRDRDVFPHHNCIVCFEPVKPFAFAISVPGATEPEPIEDPWHDATNTDTWACAQCGPANHSSFHLSCIKMWTTRRSACPCCRAFIPPTQLEPLSMANRAAAAVGPLVHMATKLWAKPVGDWADEDE